jgi:hypothetical protein
VPGLDDPTVRLRGGTRDGQVATVDPEVTRLYTPSEAPGLLDVYEEVDAETDGEDITAIFEFTGQVPADLDNPEQKITSCWTL